MSDLKLDGVYVADPDPEQYVRRLAADVLGTDNLDLSGVSFLTDANGLTIAVGRVVAN